MVDSKTYHVSLYNKRETNSDKKEESSYGNYKIEFYITYIEK